MLLQVPFTSMINNSCQGGALVAAILTGDAAMLGSALDRDVIIEPARAPLIPGMVAVKEAAKAAGGCSTLIAHPLSVELHELCVSSRSVPCSVVHCLRCPAFAAVQVAAAAADRASYQLSMPHTIPCQHSVIVFPCCTLSLCR
eukprot:GHRQ01030384.1.p1 GENE.GHRQ01030384.1~~GHRQ01030384.1.p1  ORF type:complete len:143 (-),score=32.18 GHRQ01030384.1:38-466(-)